MVLTSVMLRTCLQMGANKYWRERYSVSAFSPFAFSLHCGIQMAWMVGAMEEVVSTSMLWRVV